MESASGDKESEQSTYDRPKDVIFSDFWHGMLPSSEHDTRLGGENAQRKRDTLNGILYFAIYEQTVKRHHQSGWMDFSRYNACQQEL